MKLNDIVGEETLQSVFEKRLQRLKNEQLVNQFKDIQKQIWNPKEINRVFHIMKSFNLIDNLQE